jgi:hypothetical protein
MGFWNKKETPKAEPSPDEMECPSCGTMVAKDAVMCYACGAKLRARDASSGKKRIV